jgi:hypothetical protein
LRNGGANVIAFTERFERGTDDEVWLGEVRDKGWLLFTRDDRWRYHRAELLAIIAEGCRDRGAERTARAVHLQGDAGRGRHRVSVAEVQVSGAALIVGTIPPILARRLQPPPSREVAGTTTYLYFFGYTGVIRVTLVRQRSE